MIYSARYDAALALAARVHRGQQRKGSDVPYVTHAVHVSLMLLRCGYDEDVAIAGLLHDVVEDQRYPLAQVAAAFGERVAGLVGAVSEHRYERDEDERERPWELRKQEKLAALRTAGAEVLAITAADLLHNVGSTLADFERVGPELWSRFTRGRDGLLWYYRAVADLLCERQADAALVAEVMQAVAELERRAAT